MLGLEATDTRLVGVGVLREGSGADLGGGLLTSVGEDDILAFELTPSGAHQWSQLFGDTERQAARAVTIDAAGNVLMTGAMFGTARGRAGLSPGGGGPPATSPGAVEGKARRSGRGSVVSS